jgi:hypothetical protein
MELFAVWYHYFISGTCRSAAGENPQPVDRYLPLARLCLDLVRSEADSQPEGIIVGAGQNLW